MTRYLPIFPLGGVLVPTQILPLHVFEERYRLLMETLTGPGSPAELGIVLIERGSEVGGGDVRMPTGTVSYVIESEQLPDGRWLALLAGSHRFKVARWLADDPYPHAEVDEIADEAWDPVDDELLAQTADAVRTALALAAELGETPSRRVPFSTSPDPSVAAWELVALAPIGPLDRQRLLEASCHHTRLELLLAQAADMAEVLAFRLQGR